MLRPLRSEEDAFRLLVAVAFLFAPVILAAALFGSAAGLGVAFGVAYGLAFAVVRARRVAKRRGEPAPPEQRPS